MFVYYRPVQIIFEPCVELVDKNFIGTSTYRFSRRNALYYSKGLFIIIVSYYLV